MRLKKLAVVFILALIISPDISIIRAQALTVGVSSAQYEPGEEVMILGTATAGINVTILVFFNSTVLSEQNVTVEGDGNYTTTYDLPGDAENGTYGVNATAGIEYAETSFEVVTEDSADLAENLMDAAEDIKEDVEEAFEELEGEGIEVPSSANASYLLGIEALAMAGELFEAGNYTGSAIFSTEAIQHFGDAFLEVEDLIPVEPDDGDGPDDCEGIPFAIERALAYWERLNETVTRLEEDGHNVTRIKEVLIEAKEVLDEALLHVSEENFTAAREDFTRARSVLGRINGYINSRIKERKEKQAEQFMEQFQRRIHKINETIDGLQAHLDAGKLGRVKGNLNAVNNRLNQLRRKLTDDELEDLLDELEDAVDDIEDGLRELNGNGFSTQIKNLNKVEARIQVLNKTAERLRKKGEDIAETLDEIDDAEDLLLELQDLLVEGNVTAIRDLLEEAEDRFDELGNELKGILKSNKAQAIKDKIVDKIQKRLLNQKSRGKKDD